MNKEKEKEKTNNRNRNASLVSSHSDNENDGNDGHLLVCDNNGSPLSELSNRDDIEARFGYKPRPSETVVYEEIYIPDVDADDG